MKQELSWNMMPKRTGNHQQLRESMTMEFIIGMKKAIYSLQYVVMINTIRLGTRFGRGKGQLLQYSIALLSRLSDNFQIQIVGHHKSI